MAELAQYHRATGIRLFDHVAAKGGLTRLLRRGAALIAVPLGLMAIAGWIEPGVSLGMLLLIMAPIYFLARTRLDAFALAAAIGFLLVAYVPALNFAIDGDWRHAPVMAVALGFMAIFEMVMRRAAGGVSQGSGGASEVPMLLGWIAIAMLLPAMVGERTQSIAFIIPFAISLVHFDRLCSAERARRIAMLSYATALIIYAAFYWDSYGRLLFGAMAAMPLLLLVRRGAFQVPPFLLVLGVPPLLWLAQWVRGDQLSAEGIAESSISSPSILSVQMMEVLPVLPTRVADFADQFLLFFFSWVPRVAWDDKPLGLGWTMVGELTSRRGVSEGHSVAPGLIGESLWLLGPNFMLGLGVQVLAVMLLGLLVRRIGAASGLAAMVVASLLPTLVWGGMASFGARLWFFLLPIFLYAFALHLFDGRRAGGAL